MNVRLVRFSYSQTETEGVLEAGDYKLATIERPWKPADTPGGTPFKSCVPDGVYQLEPFTRPSGEQCWLMVSEYHGVYRHEGDGRYLCLIHAGNWVTDVVGCIAPGMRRQPMQNPKTNRIEQAVAQSGKAMQALSRTLGHTETHRLIILPGGTAFQRT